MRLHMVLRPVKGNMPTYMQKTIYNIQIADHPGWIHSHVPSAFKAPLKYLTQNAPDILDLHFVPRGDTTRYLMQNTSNGVFVYSGDPTPLEECDNYIDYNTTGGADNTRPPLSPSTLYAMNASAELYEPPPRRQRLV